MTNEVWCRWVQFDENFNARAVTAAPWGQLGFRFALFATDANGILYTAAGDPQTGPAGAWGPISDGFVGVPGAPVTAVPWSVGFNLFAIDANGHVCAAAGDPQTGLVGAWGALSDGFVGVPGAPVTAVPWEKFGWGFALFAIDANGLVCTAAGNPQTGLAGAWGAISDGFVGVPGAPVTAVPWGEGFALFATDSNGRICTTKGDPQNGFLQWAYVSDGSATPRSSLNAIPYTPLDPSSPTISALIKERIALFIVDPNDRIDAGLILDPEGDPMQPIGIPHDDAAQEILEIINFRADGNPDPGNQDWDSSPLDDQGQSKFYPLSQALEWSQVLNTSSEYENQSTVVGASGWVRSPDNSKADVPFDHPFGGLEHFPFGRTDWEFGLFPDTKYKALLSHANQGWTSDEPSEAPGTLGVEWDQALIPASFRGAVSHGDRVAVFGRWILDQGHPYPIIDDCNKTHYFYRTEIHPPLFMATGSLQRDPQGNTVTRVLFMTRPFLVGQHYTFDPDNAYSDELDDQGPLLQDKPEGLMNKEIALTALGHGGFEAYTKIKSYPFVDIYSFQILIRPPALSWRERYGPCQLAVSCQFTARSGSTVMIHPPSDANDAVVVLVGLDNRHRSYTPPRLPDGMPRVYTLEDLDLMTPGVKSQILHGLYSDKRLDYQWFTHPRQNVLNALGKGIKTMEYNRLPEVPILDRGNAVSTVLPGPGSPSIIPAGWGVSRNDLQPYPVYGWLELKWTDSEQRRGS